MIPLLITIIIVLVLLIGLLLISMWSIGSKLSDSNSELEKVQSELLKTKHKLEFANKMMVDLATSHERLSEKLAAATKYVGKRGKGGRFVSKSGTGTEKKN